MDDQDRTRFTSDGLNIGWVKVVSRSAIVKRFGHVFGFVDLTDKQFQGFEFYGFAERPYAGTPACVLSLPRAEQPDRPLAGWFRRPSLHFFVQREGVPETWQWTIEELFDQIEQEITAWPLLNEFERRHGKPILYCSVKGQLVAFPGLKAKGLS